MEPRPMASGGESEPVPAIGGAEVDGFSAAPPNQGPEAAGGPMMTTTSGSSRSRRPTASRQAARSSGATALPPVSSGHSSGGDGHRAAPVIIGALPVAGFRPLGEPPNGTRGRGIAADRGYHGQHVPGLAHVVGPEYPSSQPGRDGRRAQRPGQPFIDHDVQGFADEVLVR